MFKKSNKLKYNFLEKVKPLGPQGITFEKILWSMP